MNAGHEYQIRKIYGGPLLNEKSCIHYLMFPNLKSGQLYTVTPTEEILHLRGDLPMTKFTGHSKATPPGFWFAAGVLKVSSGLLFAG